MLKDYGIVQDIPTVYEDNTSTINISKNLFQCSKTKHIDIRQQCICDIVNIKIISLEYIKTENQLANVFTKALNASRFDYLRKAIGISSM